MKTAVIYFKGKEVCRVEFESMCDLWDLSFYKEEGKTGVAFFPKGYGYSIVSAEDIQMPTTQEIIDAQEAGRNVAKGRF